MKFQYDSKEGITKVQPETSDICVLCSLFCGCPLLQALEINLVYPSADTLTIQECPMFEMVDISD